MDTNTLMFCFHKKSLAKEKRDLFLWLVAIFRKQLRRGVSVLRKSVHHNYLNMLRAAKIW
jgi:hypothetical protein